MSFSSRRGFLGRLVSGIAIAPLLNSEELPSKWSTLMLARQVFKGLDHFGCHEPLRWVAAPSRFPLRGGESDSASSLEFGSMSVGLGYGAQVAVQLECGSLFRDLAHRAAGFSGLGPQAAALKSLLWSFFGCREASSWTALIRIMPVRTCFRSLVARQDIEVNSIGCSRPQILGRPGAVADLEVSLSGSPSIQIPLNKLCFSEQGGGKDARRLVRFDSHRGVAGDKLAMSSMRPAHWMQTQVSVGVVEVPYQGTFDGLFPRQEEKAQWCNRVRTHVPERTLVFARIHGETVEQLLWTVDDNLRTSGLLVTTSTLQQLSRVPGVPEALHALALPS